MADLYSVFKNMTFGDDYQGMRYNSRVLIVDSTNLFIRNYAAVPSMDDDGRHIGGTIGFLKSLGAAIRQFKPTRVIAVFDGKGGSQRRRKIFPQYKQNRKPPVRLNRAYDLTTDEQEKQNMKFQLIKLIELLELLPLTLMALDNVEADDVIAYVSQLVAAQGGKSIIYSTDKDFLQLASDTVSIFNPVKKKTFSEDVILEDYGIHPKHFYFFRALNGDKSDNIDGVKGVGEVVIKKYIPEISDPLAKVDLEFIKSKYAGQKKIPKVISNIINNEDIVNRNILLMNLHDGIMSSDARLRVASTFNNVLPTFSKHDLTTALVKAKLIGAFSNYDLWITQTFIPLIRFTDDT